MPLEIAAIVAVAQNLDATSSEIGAALAQARAAAIEAESASGKADHAYQDGLIGLDDKSLTKLANERTAAEVRRDRTLALVTKLETRLTEAQAREAEAARSAAHTAALANRDAAVSRFRSKYPGLVALGLDLMRDLAEADAAVDVVNTDLPAGADRLLGAEHVARTVPGLAREVIADVEVDLWCREGSAEPAPEDVQARVIKQNDRRGYLSTGTGQHYFILQRFRRVSFRPVVRPLYSVPLAEALALPPLQPGDALAWTPEAASIERPSPTLILSRLARIEQAAAVKPGRLTRGVEVEYLPVASSLAA